MIRLVPVLWMVFPLFRRRPDGERTRARIKQVIAEEPGIHKSELCRRLGMAWGTISHHLRIMAHDDDVLVTAAAGRSRAFPPTIPSEYHRSLAALRSDPNAEVYGLLRDRPLGIQGLCQELGISRKVARRCLTTLEEVGLVERDGDRFEAQDALGRLDRWTGRP